MTTTQKDDLIECLLADGTMCEVTLAGTPTPMIASIVNAIGLADASALMLARLACAGWCADERGRIADAMLALAQVKLYLNDVLACTREAP